MTAQRTCRLLLLALGLLWLAFFPVWGAVARWVYGWLWMVWKGYFNG